MSVCSRRPYGKLTRSRLSICTICRHITFESFLKHGRSNSALASTIAFDCSLVLLAIFTLVLPVIRKMPVVVLPELKSVLKKIKLTSQADENQDDWPSTVPWGRQHASPLSSSAFSSPASPPRSPLPQTRTPPPRPARPQSPYLPEPLPQAKMRAYSGRRMSNPYGGWGDHATSASTTVVSLHAFHPFSSNDHILGEHCEV